MSKKCRRCANTIISVTGETCLCGEPLYSLYFPKEGEFPVDNAGARGHGLNSRKPPQRRSAEYAYLSDNLFSEVRKFCARYSFPASVFGRRFLNDPGFVSRLQNGAIPRDDTIKRLRQSMRDYECGNK